MSAHPDKKEIYEKIVATSKQRNSYVSSQNREEVRNKKSNAMKQLFSDGIMNNKGENGPMYGKHHTKKAKEKIGKYKKK